MRTVTRALVLPTGDCVLKPRVALSSEEFGLVNIGVLATTVWRALIHGNEGIALPGAVNARPRLQRVNKSV
jgi:hypothetical protein